MDITTLTEDQWLSWRRKGIGGSDVAVALNSSPYRTARDLYYDKIGVVMSDDGPDKSITFQIGHLLEDVVAQIFAKKTGLSVYEDHWMYQHPFFPFLIADVDRFVTLPDGRKAILECKTAHYDMQFKWANGAVPRHYELQVRHYMSVMNTPSSQTRYQIYETQIDDAMRKIEKFNQLKAALYGDFADGLLSHQDYTDLSEDYSRRADDLRIFIAELEKEKEKYSVGFGSKMQWALLIEKYKDQESLDAEMAAAFIETLTLFNDGHVEVAFRHRDEIEQVLYVAATRGKEAERYAG